MPLSPSVRLLLGLHPIMPRAVSRHLQYEVSLLTVLHRHSSVWEASDSLRPLIALIIFIGRNSKHLFPVH